VVQEAAVTVAATSAVALVVVAAGVVAIDEIARCTLRSVLT
jgi:hypothetical protein